MIVAAHQTMLAPPALPFDAEVEYLESTGTQYVDTGIVYSSGMRTELDIQFGASTSIAFFGARTSGNTTKCYDAVFYNSVSGAQKNIRFDYCSDGTAVKTQNFTPNGSIPSDTRLSLSFDGPTLTYPGGSITATLSAQSFSTDYTLYLFAVNTAGTATITSGSTIVIYGCKIYSGTTLARDFQPVRVGSGSSAVGYFYDRVSGELFGNAGTGAFTIGPDK